MWLYICVAAGGAVGTVGRFFITNLMTARLGSLFPYGTLMVNVLGSFLIGWFFFASSATGKLELNENFRQLFLVGLCGGFTTFSSFSLQTLLLLRDSEWLRAGTYVAGSVVLCLFFVWLGYIIAANTSSGA